MITIQTQSDGVLFNFQDSTRYLYGDGSILTPYNSLTLIADESNVLTFRKSASNDIFITAGYDELGYSSKEEAINDLKTKLFKATGGGSESGITEEEVQTMIDDSLEDYYDKDEIDAGFASVDATLSGKADASVLIQAMAEATAAILAVSGDVQAISSDVSGKQDALRYYTEDSDGLAQIAVGDGYVEVYNGYVHLGAGNTELRMNTSAITVNDEAVATEPYVDAATSGKADTSAVTAVSDALTAHTSDSGIHVSQVEKNAWNAKLDASAYTPVDLSEYWTSAQTEVAISAATSGKADTSAVTAVENDVVALQDALAGKANTAALTAHTSDTDIHVSAQEKSAWNAKAEPYSAGTGIEISGNVISATAPQGDYYEQVSGLTIDTYEEDLTPKIFLEAEGDGQRNENVFNRWGIETYQELEDGSSYSSGLGGGTIYNGATDYPDDNVTSERNFEISTDGFRQFTLENYDDGESSYTRYQSDNEFNYTNGLILSQQWYDEKNDTTTDSHISIVNNNGGETYIQLTDTNERTVIIEPNMLSWNDGRDSVDIEWSNIATLDDIPEYSAGTGIEIRNNVISCTVSGGGGGGSVTVDSDLDLDSKNPVANSAVTFNIYNLNSMVDVKADQSELYYLLDGSTDEYDPVNPIRLMRISQSDYDDLANGDGYDPDTLYIITPDVENEGGNEWEE